MAFLTILVLLLSLSDWVAADTCGTSGRSCIDRATCNETTSTCHCNHPYTWGDGFFQCYTSDEIAAEAKNDVHITTLNNETVDFPFPCRYLVTHAKNIEHFNPGSFDGDCEVMVHAFSKRFRGKIVTYGYDLALRIFHFDYGQNGHYINQGIRIYGTAENGVKNITTMANWENKVIMENYNGPWYKVDGESLDQAYAAEGITNITYTEDDYKTVFNVVGCGVVVTFIPYDTELRRHQKHVPGLSVSFKDDHHLPGFPVNNKSIGLGPLWYYGRWTPLSGILYGNLTASQSLVRRAMLNSEDIQNQPDKDEGDSCEQAAETMSYCDDQESTETSFESCYWMLEEPRFIRCLNDHGLNHFSFFQRCVKSHCLANADDCHEMMELVSTHCKLTEIGKVRDFLDGELCP